MDGLQSAPSSPTLFEAGTIFELPKKVTIIRLRWPVVLICSYLLLFSKTEWFAESPFAAALLVAYLLSNAALYFLREQLFGSTRFYTILVAFDTLFLTACLVITGKIGTDFYLAYFLIIIVASLCQDFRYLILLAVLAPIIYGYVLSQTAQSFDPSVYLRVPFLFIVSLFYGYFTQLVRIEITKQEETQAQVQHQRERHLALHDINLAMTSILDLKAVVKALLEKIEPFLPAGTSSGVRLLKTDPEGAEVLACRNLDEEEWRALFQPRWPHYARVMVETKSPVVIANLQTDPGIRGREFFVRHGLSSYLGLPLVAKGELLGILSFYTKEKHQFSHEDMEFFSTLSGQAAIAIHNSKLYEKVVTANRVKDAFLSIMSHELRTPLNVITGYAGLIRDGMLGKTNGKQDTALEKILSHSNDLLAHINSILYTTALEAGDIKLDSREVSPSDLLDHLRLNYQDQVKKGVALTWDYPPDLPVIKTDGAKLTYILQRLIGNAIKFTDRGAVAVSVRYLTGARILEFKVADTGLGISEEEILLIFDKFCQVDSSETRSYGGMGLGLYIARQFTELLGGKIEIQSELGKGSTFTVILPTNL